MMLREPPLVLSVPGVYALVNRKRRYAYVAYSANLQKRSHSMSHMLMQHDADPGAYWPIKDLPKHHSDEYVFIVISTDVKPEASRAGINMAQKEIAKRNYRIIDGFRAASPMVTVDGKPMTLADAVKDHSNVKYLTAYRRLERGWTTEQALGLKPPSPRWHHQEQAKRRERAKEAA